MGNWQNWCFRTDYAATCNVDGVLKRRGLRHGRFYWQIKRNCIAAKLRILFITSVIEISIIFARK